MRNEVMSLALKRRVEDGGRIAVTKAHVVAISTSLNSLHRIRVLYLQVASSDVNAPVCLGKKKLHMASRRRRTTGRLLADLFQAEYRANAAVAASLAVNQGAAAAAAD
jgi:hypothetical protein